MGEEKWANETVSEKVVKPRYDASLTWIPRGAKGSLVLIGGVKDGLYMKMQISLMGKITKDVAEKAVSIPWSDNRTKYLVLTSGYSV
jgi:hypothetical protein